MENLKLSEQFLSIEEEEKEGWRIDSDLSADWTIRKIKAADAELERLKKVVNDEIQQLQEFLKKEQDKRDREVSFFESKLIAYFNEISKNAKETKTQLSYKLPSGVLKMKKASKTFNYDKSKLLAVAEKNKDMGDYVKIKKDFDWAEFKKQLDIRGDKIIARETGEVIELEGLSIIEKPAVFKVEVE